MTSEGAFPYLARSLGLRELFLWAVNADQQGTPQQVQKVIDSVRAIENEVKPSGVGAVAGGVSTRVR